jgi:hypothetical protein
MMTEKLNGDRHVGREKYERLITAAQQEGTIKVAAAHPCDEVSLRGAIDAHKLGLIDPILVARPNGCAKRPRRRISTSAHSRSLRRRTAMIRLRKRSGSSRQAVSKR